jgi:hypothetical protein
MSSIMKIFKNSHLFHSGLTASATATATANETNRYIDKTDEIRFTKILTKYSTEYNNQIFFTVFVKDGDG